MAPRKELDLMVREIYNEPELNGCIVGYQGDNESRILHKGMVPSFNYGRIYVVIERTTAADQAFERDEDAGPKNATPAQPNVVTNRSKLGRELIGAGLSCGMSVVAGVGVLGGAAAEVPTAGGSTVLVVLAWTGFVTSGVQCINSIARLGAIYESPEGDTLERWDKNSIYKYSILIVDGIGIVAGVASLPAATKNLLAVLRRQGSLMTVEELIKLDKAGRNAAIQKALTEASKTKDGRKAMEEALKEAGLSSKQVESAFKAGAKSARRVRVIANAIKQETAERLNATLLGIAGTAGGVGASATPDRWTGSASGSVNWLIHILKPDDK